MEIDLGNSLSFNLNNSPVPILYTDSINGKQVCRDDLWLCLSKHLEYSKLQVMLDEKLIQQCLDALKTCYDDHSEHECLQYYDDNLVYEAILAAEKRLKKE